MSMSKCPFHKAGVLTQHEGYWYRGTTPIAQTKCDGEDCGLWIELEDWSGCSIKSLAKDTHEIAGGDPQ